MAQDARRGVGVAGLDREEREVSIESAIEFAATKLPSGWSVRIEVEKGSAWVEAIRPDGTKVDIVDDEYDLEQLVGEAVRLALDEVEADKLLKEEVSV